MASGLPVQAMATLPLIIGLTRLQPQPALPPANTSPFVFPVCYQVATILPGAPGTAPYIPWAEMYFHPAQNPSGNELFRYEHFLSPEGPSAVDT